MRESFTPDVLTAFGDTKYLYIRSGDHRFIPVWVVVVEGRVIVRSWNDKAEGWYRAFLEEPHGDVKLNGEQLGVRAVRLRSSRINNLADVGYADKYTTKANQKYVIGFKTPRRKATTLELLPG